MKDLEYFNRLIEDVVVHVDGLILEQSLRTPLENEKTDEELIQDIIDASERNTDEDVDVQQIFDDLEDGNFRKAFGVEEKDIDKWFRENPTADYVIEGGKQAGKTISKTTYTSIRTFRAQAQARRFASQNTLKKLKKKEGTKSYCHCLKLVRTFIDMDDAADEPAKCPNKVSCKSNFEDAFESEIDALNSYDKEIQQKHYDDCLDKYDGKKLWSLKYREDVDERQQCKKWDKNIKNTISDIMSKLTSMASQWFVTTQDFKKKMTSEGDSIASKLIVYDSIVIKFDEDVFNPPVTSTPPPPNCPSSGFADCVANSEQLEAREYTFEPLSASPYSKGNTVMMAHGDFRMLMTFKNGTRSAPNSGSLTFYTKSTATEAVSPKVKWKGTITRLER